MKEFQETDFYQPTLSATMQGIEQQLKKSAQNNGNGSTNGLLGRFLKLGKSKSDVHTSNYVKRRAALTSTSGGDALQDDFVLAPVQLRGVEKMVHRAQTKKENVSRSHSWIYGSVKLPGDLPFGYGYDANQNATGTESSSGQSSHGGHIPGEALSTHSVSKCSGPEFFGCKCQDEYCNYLSPASAQHYHAPSCNNAYHSTLVSTNRKFPPQLLPDPSKKFANSVRKLTWKSLKQAVKKRPSLDSIIATKKLVPEVGGSQLGNYAHDDFLSNSKIPSSNYFFPEKKNSHFYASCTDLFGPESPQHITASVRLRPKRSRPTWNFPNEFGPVPNYAQQEEHGIYHSEWDLRQCAMPYEQWLTSSSSSRQNVAGHQFLDDLFSSPVSNVKIQSYNNGNKRASKGGCEGGKSNNGPCNGSSTSNGNGTGCLGKSSSDLYTNGGVKRFSILHNDATAYQLNKDDKHDREESDEGSEDGSHVLLSDDPVRIAGQGIFMVTGQGSGGNKVSRSNSTSSAKFKNGASFATGKGNHQHHLLLSSARSEADGVWSDTQTDEALEASSSKRSEKSYSNGERSSIYQESSVSTTQNVLKTFKQQPHKFQEESIDEFSESTTYDPETRILQNADNFSSSRDNFSKISDNFSKNNDNFSKSDSFSENGPFPKTVEPYAKTSAISSVPKTTVIKSSRSGKRGSGSEGENKYGAMRRRRLRASGGKTNLLRETIYEEESESLDPWDESHAVKILVSQSSTPDYVKPILKTRITNGTIHEDEIYDETSGMSGCRSPRKVQFNSSTQEIVISQSSSSGSGTGESESNSSDDDIDVSVRRSDDNDGSVRSDALRSDDNLDLNHDHGNDSETKSGESQGAGRKEIPIKMPLPSSLDHHTAHSFPTLTAAASRDEELPQRPRVLKNVNINEVNNLEDINSKQFKPPLQQKNDGSASFSSAKRKGPESVPAPFTVDEKMIVSKLKRMQNSKGVVKAERRVQSTDASQMISGNDKDQQKILNPNSLLFNDTTRIRLNQSRPSLEGTFHSNGVALNGKSSVQTNGSIPSRKVRPSQSFRSSTSPSGALRPKDPPPPPPRISSAPPPSRTTSPPTRTNKSQISLPMPNLGFTTTNDSVASPPRGPTSSHYQNTSSAISGKNKSKSLSEKCESVERALSQQSLSSVKSLKTPDSSRNGDDTGSKSESQNIEIVTKANSVSEIRIYSGPKTQKPLPAPKNPNLISSKRDLYHSANELFQRPSKTAAASYSHAPPSDTSRPQSTSVVLIIDTSSSNLTGNSIINQNCQSSGPSHPTDQVRAPPPPLPPSNSTSSKARNEVNFSSVGQEESKRDLLYDDVINNHHRNQSRKQKHEGPTLKAQTINSNPSTYSHQQRTETSRSSDAESLQSVYSDVGMTVSINQPEIESLYDDTLSISSGNLNSKYPSHGGSLLEFRTQQSDDSSDTLVEEEPLYDDILNVNEPGSGPVDSDSGTETDVPPPLPTSGPPLHLLPEISLEIPLIPLPVLPGVAKSGKGSISKGTNRLLGEIIEFSKKFGSRGTALREEGSDLGESAGAKGSESELSLNHSKALDQFVSSPPASVPESAINGPRCPPPPRFQLNLPDEPNTSPDDSLLLDRTRSLLNELNEKLANLNFSPEDYSTYISKVIISSSSDSSGVEEDYNSEKNYSLSNDGGESGASSTASAEENYKLSKLVSETISMARGKFLDSMKITNGKSGESSRNVSEVRRSSSPSGESDGDEPIYEEINDSNSVTVSPARVSNSSANGHGADGILRNSSPIYADTFDAKSIFDGASRNEILSFLESIRDRLTAADGNSSGTNEKRPIDSVKKSRKNAEIERNDSGIGSESGLILALQTPSPAMTLRPLPVCKDCHDSPVESRRLSGDASDLALSASPFCTSCFRKRSERKEIVQEIYETELKYGRDLRIISDEFFTPIQTAGLLSKDQLEQIFLNVGQLIEVNVILSSSLKGAITAAIEGPSPDEDLNSVNVGRIFLEIGEKMMSAFESYCTRQASAGALLTQIEKEKELLRIFLRVSQMENTVLRRMNLPAFLMVPVQRVTRYPLLLARLLKVTAPDHPTREELTLAQEKIEQHLEHMNKTTREVASVKLWRRISIINGTGNGSSTNGLPSNSQLQRRSNTDFDAASVRIRKMALDILDWSSLKDVSCVLESQLNMVQCNSAKTTRHIYAILLVRGKDLERLSLRMDQEIFFPPRDDVVKDVKLVLVRAKNARFSLLREPLCLAKCVISRGDAEFQDFIEINEITTKNTYYLQALDKQGTSLWLKLLQSHAVCVGQWRRRRGALANIMMNGMMRNL